MQVARQDRHSKASTQAAELTRMRQGMNRYARIALVTSSFFLIIMAVLVNSPPLFYMATAIIVTLGAARLQAWLAVRGLRFERIITPAVKAGESVIVNITVWSERRLKRPLVTIADHLPRQLRVSGETPSLPVAPSFDQPIQSRYSFRPMRRGRYTWSRLTVYGTDALGLITIERTYNVDPVALTVYPSPLPVSLSISPSGGWGLSELETGRATGSGLDTKGIRNYVQGDAIKTIDWKSTAKTGNLMVKEFESGTGVALRFFLQRVEGSDIGNSEISTFEAMCGHTLFLGSGFLKHGAIIQLPQMEDDEAAKAHPEVRERDLREALTDIQPDYREELSSELRQLANTVSRSDTVVILLTLQDEGLPVLLREMAAAQKIVLLYDAKEYSERPEDIAKLKLAVDPGYISLLERNGAQTYLMPRVEKLS